MATREYQTSDPKIAHAGGAIVVEWVDLEKIKDAISSMHPGYYPIWNVEKSLAENIVDRRKFATLID